jgi:hypothetical protein
VDPKSVEGIVVVAPGCAAALVQELFTARVLPDQVPFEVLLPPEKSWKYEELGNGRAFAGKVRFSLSPGRKFFSADHLKWLKSRLQSASRVNVLICQSPFKDPVTALISLLVLYLSGQTITLLFATPEAVIDLDGQGFSDKWIVQDLNREIIFKEMHRVFWFLTPWDIIYFLMFAGLIAKQMAQKTFPFWFKKK